MGQTQVTCCAPNRSCNDADDVDPVSPRIARRWDDSGIISPKVRRSQAINRPSSPGLVPRAPSEAEEKASELVPSPKLIDEMDEGEQAEGLDRERYHEHQGDTATLHVQEAAARVEVKATASKPTRQTSKGSMSSVDSKSEAKKTEAKLQRKGSKEKLVRNGSKGQLVRKGSKGQTVNSNVNAVQEGADACWSQRQVTCDAVIYGGTFVEAIDEVKNEDNDEESQGEDTKAHTKSKNLSDQEDEESKQMKKRNAAIARQRQLRADNFVRMAQLKINGTKTAPRRLTWRS